MITLEFAIYIISGSICLVLGIMLLTINGGSTIPIKDSYQGIKNRLAFSAFFDVLIDIAVVWAMLVGLDHFVMDLFLIPAFLYIQMVLIVNAELRLIYSERRNKYLNYYYLIPFVLLAITYFGTYLVNYGFSFNVQNILSFNTLPIVSYICYIFDTISLIALVFSILLLIQGVFKYKKSLTNSFSQEGVLDGSKLIYMVIGFIVYFVFAGIDNILSIQSIDSATMLFNTILFVGYCIFMFNLQNTFLKVKPIIEEYNATETNPVPELIDKQMNLKIEKKMNEWKSRDDIPFTKSGITISEVAENLNLRTRLLSEYLNEMYEMNFNTWINTLRVEYIKKILMENHSSKINLTEISYNSGFTDLAAMSRSFKKIVGVSPSQFMKTF